MRYIKELHEGETNSCHLFMQIKKKRRRQENGKPYDNLILQDKTGTLDGKIWDRIPTELRTMMKKTSWRLSAK